MKELPQVIKESWIGRFIEYASPLPTPDIFKLWSGIACVMGALERRVWVTTVSSELFPNHFILLVAPPGVGKSMIIKEVQDFWNDTHTLKVGPDAATKAAMVDCINAANRSYIDNEGQTCLMKSLQVATPEFGTLINEYNVDTMNFYNKMWDAPTQHKERLRYGDAKIVDLEYASLMILGGTQPAYLGTILPDDAFGMGFAARLVLIYSADAIRPKLFCDDIDVSARATFREELVKDLQRIVKINGSMKFSPEGRAYLEEWYAKDNADAVEHPKLVSYNTRRAVTLQKIAMGVAAACDSKRVITDYHLDFALTCMQSAEDIMPEIFKGMKTQKESVIMSELLAFVKRLYSKTGKPVHEHIILHFLKERMELRSIDMMIKQSLACGMLKEARADSGGDFSIHKRYLPGKDI